MSENVEKHSGAIGTGPRESCCNWRCSHPYSLGYGKWILSAGPTLSLGFVFHALRSRTNWVPVSFCSVAHYPRERLKAFSHRPRYIIPSNNGWVSIVLLVPSKYWTHKRHYQAQPFWPLPSSYYYGKNELWWTKTPETCLENCAFVL